jgi:hypothetical protein
MAAYEMAAVKVIPPNDFSLGLIIRSHMVVIHLFLMLCNLQRVVRDLWPTPYIIYLFHICKIQWNLNIYEYAFGSQLQQSNYGLLLQSKLFYSNIIQKEIIHLRLPLLAITLGCTTYSYLQ